MHSQLPQERGGDDDGDWYTSTNWLPLTLFWIASPLVLLHGIGSLSWLLYRLRDREHITPAIMFPPVASLVAAMAAIAVAPREANANNSYTELAYVWYGFGMTTMIILLPITFNRVLLGKSIHSFLHSALCIMCLLLALSCTFCCYQAVLFCVFVGVLIRCTSPPCTTHVAY